MEHIPWLIGVLVVVVGVALIADAWLPDETFVLRERRRRQRAERHRGGEGILGVGALCIAAALFGRDTWGYGTLAVLIGTALLLIGAVLNRRYLKELLLYRGAARRVSESEDGIAREGSDASQSGPVLAPPPDSPPAHTPPAHTKLRIR